MASIRVTAPLESVAGTTLYEAVGGSSFTRRVAIVSWMHGNEPVGGDVLDHLEGLVGDELISGSLLTIRANLAAHADNLRHTGDGVDLNRLYDSATLSALRAADPETLNYEETRALELAPLLLSCDVILDLHSTSRPTEAFLLFRDDQAHGVMARKLCVPNLVTGLHENGIIQGGLGANVGLRAAERSSRLGFTFEAGQHLDPGNKARGWDVSHRLLFEVGLWKTPPPKSTVRGEVYEVQERFLQAPDGAVPYRFVGFKGGEPGGGRQGPPRQLHSFDRVQADEVILRRGRNHVVRAQTPFTMLMPSPDTGPATDLYYVTQPRHGGLTEGGVRTDEQARTEAGAIERMLDLLADDNFARGSTWVAFDNRRLLDLCASVIGRTLRLDRSDPNRKIVVVGRGESGGDEGERRAGQRYRQAMRRAIADGLPVERIQVMRGAPLSWLDTLTSVGMQDLLRRRSEHAAGPGGVRLRVSVRQPHTVSILAAGDLRRALRTGDTRHVRVVLLIEAATVEPDLGTARVRILRAGMVSGRLELVRAAAEAIDALRREHRHLVTSGALSGPIVQPFLDSEYALEAVADPDRMIILRNSLLKLQLRLWVDALQHEVVTPSRIRSPAALGRWLASTMSTTGILDPEALKQLCIRQTGKEWMAEPSRVAAAHEALMRPDVDLDELDETGVLPSSFTHRTHASTTQPCLAADLVADDLERWIGWKRFVRGAQMLADTRGKDLDLAFDEDAIQKKFIQWFRYASERGAVDPGSTLVVVAGDGLNPKRENIGQAWELLRAHRDLLRDSTVRYLRIQHAQGTHLAWLKDFFGLLEERPDGESVALQFEAEHGATVNVVMVATRDASQVMLNPWTLEGWSIECCGVILSDLEGEGDGRHYKVAMFTDRSERRINQELLHFGRAHCEGLLKQAGARVRGAKGAPEPIDIEQAMIRQIARWIERVRTWKVKMPPIVDSREARIRWVARSLGLADERLASSLVGQMDEATPVEDAAAALWASVAPWPGPLWQGMRTSK